MCKYPTFGSGLRTYNLDETGLTTVQVPQKVLADISIRRLNKVTSAERGTLITACCIVSADGNHLPPVLIFPRKKFKPHMLHGAPPGSLGVAYPTGWMTGETFEKVMEHFVTHTHSSKENPTLLIFDNHESHLGPNVIDYARKYGVSILTIPPHCSGRLQPLDVSVYESLKGSYHAAMDSWMYQHPGQTITMYDIPGLFGEAFKKSMTPSNIMSGFKACGIHPFDRDIFSDDDFLVSYVTDRPTESESVASHTAVPSVPCSSSSAATNYAHLSPTLTEDSLTPKNLSNISCVALDLPKAGARKGNKNNRRRKSCIATSTPEMEAIKERHRKTNAKKVKKRLAFPETKKCKKTKTRKTVLKENEESDGSDENVFISDLSEPESFSKISVTAKSPQNTGAEKLEDDSELQLKEGNFYVVKFTTEEDEQEKYYIGQILVIRNSLCTFSFLHRQTTNSQTFVFPHVPDIDAVPKENVLDRVQNCPKERATARTSRIFNFIVDKKYKNLY